MHQATEPLSHDRVVEIAGDLKDSKVAAILATGATVEDLLEAVAWASSESDVMGKSRHPLSGQAERLYEILTVDEELEEERGQPD